MNDRLNALVAPLRANVMAWYSGRQPNEQRLLRIAAIVVPLLIVLVVLSSLQSAVTRLDKRVTAKRSDLAYLHSVAPLLAPSSHPHVWCDVMSKCVMPRAVFLCTTFLNTTTPRNMHDLHCLGVTVLVQVR